MKQFDKHIQDKMQGMKVSPSPKLKANLQQQYPKQSFVQTINPFVGGLAVVAAISLLVFLALQITNNPNLVYSPTPLNTEAYQPIDNPQVINMNTSDKANALSPKENHIIADNTEDSRTGCKSTFCTYQNQIEIPVELEQYSLLFTDDGLNVHANKQNTKIIADTLGDYLLIIASKTENRLDTMLISFLAAPKMPDLKDTMVCGLEFSINTAGKSGDFRLPDGLSMRKNRTDFSIMAEQYCKYKLVYFETDEIGTFTHEFVVEFIPAEMPEVQIVKNPRCYLDNAVIQLDLKSNEKGEVSLSHGNVEILDNQSYRLNFDYETADQIYCFIKYHQAACNLFDTLMFDLPEKPDYNMVVNQANCNHEASLMVESYDANALKVFLNQEQIELQKTISMIPGDYQLQFLDENACVITETFSILEQNNLHASFEFQTALDGMSVRVTNNTKGIDVFDADVEYQWYVNGKLVSEQESPTIELTQISNTIRLFVKLGMCEDEMIVSDIQPDKGLIRCANFFTPNGDGQFDFFKVLVDPSLTRFAGKIFNRAGQLVYEWTDANEAWDGKFAGNQDATEGVYFYAIQAVDSTGQIIEKRGTIQLIRD
ncbi:MAG: gliding motility-associated C-terminal domain-containing protein [Bacteroidota bacterium]|nr:gliding motility-associated C-terminal domain-containing protein [Bacteroidota bacterium]